MRPAEQDFFKTALRAQEAELLKDLQKREELATEAEPDIFDEMQRALGHALVIQNLDRKSLLFRQVRAALARLADGTYGRCVKCEEPINPRRLAALPWAQFCLRCQEQADREVRERPPDDVFPQAA